MFIPDLTNAEYDESLELLAHLPRDPYGAPMAMLAVDLGLENQQEVRRVADGLAAVTGIKFITRRESGMGIVMSVDRQSWKTAVSLATKYVERVDGC